MYSFLIFSCHNSKSMRNCYFLHMLAELEVDFILITQHCFHRCDATEDALIKYMFLYIMYGYIYRVYARARVCISFT